MDFPDLNFIRSEIDPATVKPLNTRELIGFVNEFMLTSADLLDSFCGRFEQSILALENRMDSFERQLILLERKLADIPLKGIPSTSKANEGQNLARNEIQMDKIEEKPIKEEQQNKQMQGNERKLEKEEMKIEKTTKTTTNSAIAKEHPLLGKYFRMLKMGVPEPAVWQKMRTESIDPAILNEPEKQIPISAGVDQKEQSSSTDSDTNLEEDNNFSSSPDNYLNYLKKCPMETFQKN